MNLWIYCDSPAEVATILHNNIPEEKQSQFHFRPGLPLCQPVFFPSPPTSLAPP